MSFHVNRRMEFLGRPVTTNVDTILGNTVRYGVQLQLASVSSEQRYWRVLGVYHLTPEENQGKHAVYVDVVDEAGNRVRDPNLRLHWGWEGQRPDEQVNPKAFDKPDSEPATNLDLYKGQHLWVQIEGDGLPSDRVCNCHTSHTDEPGPHGETWNSFGHHSFYVLFQCTRLVDTQEEEDGTTPILTSPDQAVYVRDQIADGSRCQPNATLQQIWTVRNTGTTTWGPGYALAYEQGAPLNAALAIPVPTTPPGAEVDLHLPFTAPSTPGRCRSDWKLRNAAGEWFGERLWIDIQVEQIQPPTESTDQGNKLGFYLHLSTDQHGLWEAIRRVQPPVLLIHADTANTMLLEEIRRFRAPEAFVIGRLYKDVNAQRQMLESPDPEGQGRALAEEILNYNFGLATKRGANGRLLIDAWMSLNEPVPGPGSAQFTQQPAETARLLQNYDRFQVAFRQKLQERGVEAIAFNFGAGNFSTAEHYLAHFPNTLATYTYLGFHEYGWPTLYPAPGSATSGGAYRPCMDGIRARYGDRHRVVITEAGLARMYQNPAGGDVGWLNGDTPLTEEHYWQSLAWYNGQMTADDYVVGACLFEVGHHGQWASFRHLGPDNQSRPIGIVDRIVALKDAAQPRGVGICDDTTTVVESLPLITISGVVTGLGRPLAGATVRLTGSYETLGGVRDAALAAATAVTWTRQVTGFRGAPWHAWRKFVADEVAGITYAEFQQLVGRYNPKLGESANRFTADQSYWLPENSKQTEQVWEIVWDRPLTNFEGSLHDCWRRHVANKVVGLSYQAFKKAMPRQNSQLVQTQGHLRANERYILPRNADQQTYTLVTVTGARGRFRFANLPAGDYQVTIQAAGMQPFLTGFSAVDNIQLTAPLRPNLSEQASARSSSAANAFVHVYGNEFAVNRRPFRFIGVNIRGLVHYGDPLTLAHATDAHRREQLTAAYDMGARVVRCFLPNMHATPAQTIDRLAQVLALLAEFPGLYLLPALANLYADVPFRVPGDEGFYAKIDPNFPADLLTADFFTGGYRQHYLPFVQQVVAHFNNEPRILAWEIGNELKLNPLSGDLNNDPNVAALINFKLAVAAELRRLAPNHLITTGMISTHHAWLHNDTLRHRLYASPLIDFLTIHCYNEEYHNDDSGLAAMLNKPFIVEEAGFGNRYGGDRSRMVIEDLQRWFSLGARGYMQWGFMATGQDMGDGDGDSGMDRCLHHDWDALFHAYRSKASALPSELPAWILPEKPVQPIETVQPDVAVWQAGQTVFAQDWVNVRKSPGHLGKLGDDVLGMLAPGAAATIRGAVVSQDGLHWWPIHATLANGATVEGWAAAANVNVVLLAGTTPRTMSRGARRRSPTMTRGIMAGLQAVFAQSYLNLRKDPGYVSKPSDHVIGQIPYGAPVTLLSGPQPADDLTWWQVRAPLLDNSNAVGWVAEVDPNGARLLDATPPPPLDTDTPTTSAYLGRNFPIGSAATVVAVAANVRASAGYVDQPPSHVVAQALRGSKWQVLAGPQPADGLDWLQVKPLGVPALAINSGWIALADPGGIRLLTPAPVAAMLTLQSPFVTPWALSQGWGLWPEEYRKITYDGVPLKGHNGLDFATPVGTPIRAVADGVVIRVDFEPGGFGNFVLVEHAWGESLYAHLAQVDVPQNATVTAGQPLGLSGETGHCYGAHLHFGIRLFPYRRTDGWGGFCDPSPFLPPTFLAARGVVRRPQPMVPALRGWVRP